MKAFNLIAVPHKDVLEGKFTMDVYAADLWDVHNGTAPLEYRDSKKFFKRTHLTSGLKEVMNTVEKRIKGKDGDPVIQLQTPFGGGKTHTLIALYHRAREWGAKSVVMVGTVFSANQTLWGELERQLEGEVKNFKDMTPPGSEAIKRLLEKHQPALILIDETLAYITKAAGVRVGETTLADQTMVFFQELNEAVKSLQRISLVVSLAQSHIEHYGEATERYYQQMNKIFGRVERIYSPIKDEEIPTILRKRLFSRINEGEAEEVVNSFIKYAEEEGVLPEGIEVSEFRKRFLKSYPFLPDVIDVLYHRWGTFPEFQRTRGVLRILSLLIHSLKEKNTPYVSLADFDLGNEDIRREFIRYIGDEFNGIIDADITGVESGSKKVDRELGAAYQWLNIGTRSSTTIFLYSFSGGEVRGATLRDIKRSATTLDIPSGVVDEAVKKLKDRLLYLQSRDEKYYFSNQPNLNKIVLTKMENVSEREIEEMEELVLKRELSTKTPLSLIVWPRSYSEIPDDARLKLIILRKDDRDEALHAIKYKGEGSKREFPNTLIFLAPMEIQRGAFYDSIRKHLAYVRIEEDSTLTLTEEQKEDVKKNLKLTEEILRERLRDFYRQIYLPSKDGVSVMILAKVAYGDRSKLDETVYEKLKAEGSVVERISHLVLLNKYLEGKDYVSTKAIWDSSVSTPGETRFATPE
ncbi:MAG: AAA family ATPase, partial [Thermoplasmata archaeon]